MRKNSTGALFLMELIVAIFFFSLASTVCIQLFVKAHLLSKDSVNLNNAVMWSQNFAEAFDGFNGDTIEMARIFNNCIADSNGLSLQLDKDWQPIDIDSQSCACYSVNLEKSFSNGMSLAHIECFDINNCKTIYDLDVEIYVKEAF